MCILTYKSKSKEIKKIPSPFFRIHMSFIVSATNWSLEIEQKYVNWLDIVRKGQFDDQMKKEKDLSPKKIQKVLMKIDENGGYFSKLS